MLSTGDVHGCLRKLETLLRVIKYPGNVDYNGLSKGDPSASLPIVSFALTSFSPPFAKQLMEAGLELTGKTDLRFTDALYRVLRDIFHYKPILTKQQFLQWGFSQRKISLICDIINLVVQKHNKLKKPRVRVEHKDDRGEAHPTLADANTGSIRPLVVNHMENSAHAGALCPSGVNASFHGGSPGHGIMLAGQEEDKENLLNSPGVEGRLSALEAQLRTLQSGLDRLSLLERRLEEVDKQRNTDKLHEVQDGAQVISVSRESWENLMSRVLLLETKLDLSLPLLKVSPPCQPSASTQSSTSMPEASQDDLKDRLERITKLLKSTKSSTAPCK